MGSSPRNGEQPLRRLQARRGISQGFSADCASLSPRAVRSDRTMASERLSPAPRLLQLCRWGASSPSPDMEQLALAYFSYFLFVSWFIFLRQTTDLSEEAQETRPCGTPRGRERGSAAAACLAPEGPAWGPRPLRGPLPLRGPPQVHLGGGAPPPSASNCDAFWQKHFFKKRVPTSPTS